MDDRVEEYIEDEDIGFPRKLYIISLILDGDIGEDIFDRFIDIGLFVKEVGCENIVFCYRCSVTPFVIVFDITFDLTEIFPEITIGEISLHLLGLDIISEEGAREEPEDIIIGRIKTIERRIEARRRCYETDIHGPSLFWDQF